MELKIALLLTLREDICEQMSPGGGEWGLGAVNKLYTGRLRPEVQPLCTPSIEKWYPFNMPILIRT